MSTSSWLTPYQPLIESIVSLFAPLVEVAVHDLNEGKIVAIYNNLSRRAIGEPSPLHELKIPLQDFPDVFKPYYKQNWDGTPLKCTSITIRDQNRQPIGLICINMNTSLLQGTQDLLFQLLSVEKDAENPIDTFGGNVEIQIKNLISEHLKTHNLTFSSLNNKQKKDLILFLYHKGAFNFKNAVPFVAKYLNVSRASIYNYLKAD